ncbi:MAG TPA: PepSY-associated TM helix domain-containing protein [Candidatus Macondimonas sp.]|nr:PepSY-associated TM helix domain-containing protein [Candidatus Macondimonas sp.]
MNRPSSAARRVRHDAVRRLHRFLGLALGVWFAVLGLTGAVNVFYWELEEWGLPPVPEGPSVPLQEAFEVVQAAHPERTGSWMVRLPGPRHDHLWMIYPKPAESVNKLFAPLQIQMDPVHGTIVRERFWGQTPWSILYEIHATLLVGLIDREAGRWAFHIIALGGLVLLLSLFAGLMLAWPRSGSGWRRVLSIKRNAHPARRNLDLHRTGGLYSLPILALLAISGFAFGYQRSVLEPLIDLLSPLEADPKGLVSFPSGGPMLDLDRIVEVARHRYPGAEVRTIKTPEIAQDVYEVSLRQSGEIGRQHGQTQLWLDAYDGTIRAERDPHRNGWGQSLLDLVWPVHSGEFLGLPGRLLWCASGVMPTLLLVTGYRHWRRKQRKRHLAADPLQ